MEPFHSAEGIVAPLDQTDVDTDMIIPAAFLKRVERTGFGDFLFYAKRFKADGTPEPNFLLNQPRFKNANVLVAGRNFGCGSSREHAPWALQQYGFKAVIAPSFADIFNNNCAQIGLLTVALPEERVREILDASNAREGYQLHIDLERQEVTDPFGHVDHFEIDAFKKHCLLNGLDAVGLTLRHEADIARYESRRRSWLPAFS
ncbi:MAG TPA: 3-isopropylmalate dehydratase small subunit [Chloroflexota bacterium]|nr:3-isopropylmalate dehydratase small subunit [Chloroflexota bacterium]